MADPRATLRFLGATGTVTGSKFLIETAAARVLVDCGLFQGVKQLRERNREPVPLRPDRLDAVVCTHAHLDHVGFVPALVRDGYRGAVVSTTNTARLAAIVLPDSGRLQEEDAEYANRRGHTKHHPARPLYTEAEAIAALDRFRTVEYGTGTEVAPGVRVTFSPAGHILGSSIVLVELTEVGRRLVFSGDLGRRSHPLLLPPGPPPECDVLLVESTYGDRRHEREEVVLARLREILVRTVKRGGTVVIPAFAVDRTEVLLHRFAQMARAGELPDVPVFVDSPMALACLGVYRAAIAAGDTELRPEVVVGADPFDGGRLVEVSMVEDSKAIDHRRDPSIIVSASGMATGGRVLHHLERCLPDARNTVILSGFQAEGTRGRRLLEGESILKIHGRYVPVRAEIQDLSALSVHADSDELRDWVTAAPRRPETVFVVHGEANASRALARSLTSAGEVAAVPRYGEVVRVD